MYRRKFTVALRERTCNPFSMSGVIVATNLECFLPVFGLINKITNYLISHRKASAVPVLSYTFSARPLPFWVDRSGEYFERSNVITDQYDSTRHELSVSGKNLINDVRQAIGMLISASTITGNTSSDIRLDWLRVCYDAFTRN